MTIAGQVVRRIVVVNRVHWEWPADLVEQMAFPAGVELVTRPGKGFATHRRGVAGNAVLCFPGSPTGNPDERYAYKVTRRCRGAGLVIGIHGRHRGASFPFSSAASWRNPLVRAVASLLDSDVVIFQPRPHEGGVLPNYVGLDLAPDSNLLDTLPYILGRILQGGWQPEERPMVPFVYSGCVEADVARTSGLTENYQDFSPLPVNEARRAGLPVPCFAMSWDQDHPSWHGCVGEILVPAPSLLPALAPFSACMLAVEGGAYVS